MCLPFFSLLLRVARLEVAVYAEIRDTPAATGQALGVVLAVAMAHAIQGVFLATQGGWNVFRSMLPSFQSELILWLVWATVTHGISTRVCGSTVAWGAVLRTLGFAFLPGILYGWGFISETILVVSWLWRIVTILIAMHQVLGLGLARTMGVVVMGWAVGLFVTGAATMITLQVLAWLGVR